MVNAEYRWDLSPILQAVAFADGGKVFDRWEQWNLQPWKAMSVSAFACAAGPRSFQFRYRLQPRGISNMVSRQQHVLILLGVLAGPAFSQPRRQEVLLR